MTGVALVGFLGALVALLFKSRGRPGRVALEPPPAASTVPATPEPAPMIAEPANSVAEAVPEAPAAAARTPGPEEPWLRRRGPDLLVIVVLTVVGFLVRRHTLPTNGLWLDDASLAAGLKGPLSQLLTVSVDHPGFTAALMAWRHLGGGDASLAYPALVAGVVSAPLVYVALRACGCERSISALLAAATVAAQADIIYSGRVKTYAIDVLVVLGLAMLVPRLARTRWRWPTAVAWVVGAALVASLSGFALVAVAVAGVIVVLHPRSDLWTRIAAVAVQGAALGGLFLAESDTYNRHPIEESWRQTWDGFVTFHANPLRFGEDIFVHLRRVAATLVGGPEWFAGVCVVVAIAGLAVAAWRGRQAIRARYLLLVLGVALIAGLLDKLPFGPAVVNLISDGQRASLWLIPIVAIGIALALHAVRGRLPGGRIPRYAFDVAAYLAAAAVLVVALGETTPRYPFPGARSATRFVEAQLGSRDAVLLPWPAHYSFAVESRWAHGAQKQPAYQWGYWPKFHDRRIHLLGSTATADEVAPAVAGASRVYVYSSDPFNSTERDWGRTLARTLPSRGFRLERNAAFHDVRVAVWVSALTAAQDANLGPADVPSSWQVKSVRGGMFSQRLFACLHVPGESVQSDFGAGGSARGGSPTIASVIARWPSPAAARRALAAVTTAPATACLQKVIFPFRVSGVRVFRPPPTGGDRAVAYEGTIGVVGSRRALGQGALVFVVRGRASALVAGLRLHGQALDRRLLSRLVTTVSTRVNRAASRLQ